MADARIQRARTAMTEKPSRLAREIVETIVLTLLIFFAIHFSVQPYFVDGPSMQPGLRTGDLVMVNLLSYDFGSPQRGDVIVFYPPENHDHQCRQNDPQHECFVKRIIGIPGDSISITPTSVVVDSVKLNEPYIYPLAPGENENPVVIPSLHLGTGQYFVLGDNRGNSTDSRFFGPITRDSIIGKVQLVAWPLNSLEWLRNFSSVFAGLHQ